MKRIDIENQHNSNVAVLIAAYIKGTIRLEQVKELQNWLDESDFNRELFRYFTNSAFLSQSQKYIWN